MSTKRGIALATFLLVICAAAVGTMPNRPAHSAEGANASKLAAPATCSCSESIPASRDTNIVISHCSCGSLECAVLARATGGANISPALLPVLSCR